MRLLHIIRTGEVRRNRLMKEKLHPMHNCLKRCRDDIDKALDAHYNPDTGELDVAAAYSDVYKYGEIFIWQVIATSMQEYAEQDVPCDRDTKLWAKRTPIIEVLPKELRLLTSSPAKVAQFARQAMLMHPSYGNSHAPQCG